MFWIFKKIILGHPVKIFLVTCHQGKWYRWAGAAGHWCHDTRCGECPHIPPPGHPPPHTLAPCHTWHQSPGYISQVVHLVLVLAVVTSFCSDHSHHDGSKHLRIGLKKNDNILNFKFFTNFLPVALLLDNFLALSSSVASHIFHMLHGHGTVPVIFHITLGAGNTDQLRSTTLQPHSDNNIIIFNFTCMVSHGAHLYHDQYFCPNKM